MSKGVLYMTWQGNYDPSPSLTRSIASLKHWHPELEHHVAEMPRGSNVLCKSQMYDLSPFDETLFLDADTTLLGKIDYGFLKAEQFGLALCINASPWQRRYENINGHPDEVEYSSGVLFFSKAKSKDVFEEWKRCRWAYDSMCRYQADGVVRKQKENDQALLTKAIHLLGISPFVLPLNWNLHPTWQKQFFGPVKIWHGFADIPATLLKWNEEQSQPGAVVRCATLP